ncbi:MAG: hypothetical protein IT291_06585 [Deltaproteobacteria bacterium]|nr:hypothetical protein [Deltaproteobacteria bacterium]
MSDLKSTFSIGDLAGAAASVARYLPQPASAGVGLFKDVMTSAKQFASDFIGGVENVPTGDFAELIELQIEAQMEMQTTTMVSNIERSKHESKMAAIRNIRVG